MDDAEQQPDNQGEPSDKTADDDVECEDSYCAGYAVTEGDEPGDTSCGCRNGKPTQSHIRK